MKFEKINLESLPSFDKSLQDSIVEQMFHAKEQTLIKVVQMVLGRDYFVESEVKEFGFVHHVSYPGREFISYRGNLIGELVFNQYTEDAQYKMGYTFIPKTSFS